MLRERGLSASKVERIRGRQNLDIISEKLEEDNMTIAKEERQAPSPIQSSMTNLRPSTVNKQGSHQKSEPQHSRSAINPEQRQSLTSKRTQESAIETSAAKKLPITTSVMINHQEPTLQAPIVKSEVKKEGTLEAVKKGKAEVVQK